jgi:hypothetical protein
MAVSELTVNIEVTQAPLWKRIIRLPRVCRSNYTVLRRAHGRIVAAYGVWLLAGMVLSFKSSGQVS